MKKLSKFNHNVSFSHKKCPLENKKMIVFKLFQTNDQNASVKKNSNAGSTDMGFCRDMP